MIKPFFNSSHTWYALIHFFRNLSCYVYTACRCVGKGVCNTTAVPNHVQTLVTALQVFIHRNLHIVEFDLYTVEQNNGGTAQGSYDVVLKLKDADNYKWATTDNAEVTVKFVISAAENACLSQS